MKMILKIFGIFAFGLLLTGFLYNFAMAAVKGAPEKSKPGQVLQSKGQVNSPKGTPTFEIQEIERKMEEFKTGDNLSAQDRANNAKIKKQILRGTFDLRELSRLALDKHWNSISSGQQNNFVNLMTSLLETKAIFSKEQSKTKGKTYTVTYLGDKYTDNKTKAKTLSQVYVPSENVTLEIEYKLKKAPGGWKVFDVIVDNASLVENYRYQFDKIITKHGYGELVRRMQKKLSEMKAKQASTSWRYPFQPLGLAV